MPDPGFEFASDIIVTALLEQRQSEHVYLTGVGGAYSFSTGTESFFVAEDAGWGQGLRNWFAQLSADDDGDGVSNFFDRLKGYDDSLPTIDGANGSYLVRVENDKYALFDVDGNFQVGNLKLNRITVTDGSPTISVQFKDGGFSFNSGDSVTYDLSPWGQ